MAISVLDWDANFNRSTATAVDATGLNSSDAFEIPRWQQCSIQVVHAGHGASSSTWVLQATNNGTNFDTIVGSSVTTAGASGSNTIDVSGLSGWKVRVTVTGASAQAGSTLTPFFVGKNGR